jgi:uncharacterized protein YjbI with pentapeptide repeats
MKTVDVRDVSILVPSDEDDTHTTWPHADTLAGAELSHAEYSGVDLANHQWRDLRLSRLVFTGCRFTGVTMNRVKLRDVLFRECVFDYAHLARVHAVSGVAFTECRFNEAVFESCDLSGTAMDACHLADTQFDQTRMDGCDLRGSTIENLQGALSLRGVKIDTGQVPGLMASVMADLGWKIDE